MSNQTLVFEPSWFTLETIPGSGNSDVAVTVAGTPQSRVYTIRQPGVATVDGLGINGDATTERTVMIPSVDNFNASLGSGDDLLQIRGSVDNSSIDLGIGDDRLTINGPFNNSGAAGGGGNDWILFKSEVSNSFIDGGSGNDLVTFQSDVNDSVVWLGAGNNQLRFLGDATNTSVNLGGGQDRIRISNPSADTTGLVIEGASADDKLFIGSSQYKYVGDYTWENVKDPSDDLRFGPNV